MSYFLKITEKKGDKYLQIYDSSRVKGRRNNVSKCIRSLGYLSKLTTPETPDPIAHYRDYCREENRKRKDAKRLRSAETVGDEELELFAGNALVDAFLGSVGSLRLIKMRSRIYERGGKLDYAGILRDLISARLIAPASKLKTYEDVIPQLYRHGDYSLDDVYDALDGLGGNYDGAIEMFNLGIKGLYRFRTDRTYFDCTNFYFEIDREDEWRRKGPSKENRKDPILGLGLLLDANCVPVGMRIYPGNASEKPVQREMVRELKESSRIEGRTVIVADKGLNCARNIHAALSAKDGYIYSKSVASLPEREKRWVLNEEGPQDAAYVAKNGDGEVVFMRKSCVDWFDYSFAEEGNGGKAETRFKALEKRVAYFSKDLRDKRLRELRRMREKLGDLIVSRAKREECGPYSPYVKITSASKGGISVSLNEERFEEDERLAGYNMIVTSEAEESDDRIYDACHRLWRIEETFRIMKTDLSARPVYLQRINRIKGHFLVCYLAVAIFRLYQFVYLRNERKSGEILDFIRKFRVVKYGDVFINVAKRQGIMEDLNELFGLPLDSRFYEAKTLDGLYEAKLKSTTN